MGPFESDLSCAIREMYEETSIGKDKYTLIPGVRRNMCHTHGIVRYISTYYIAITTKKLDTTRAFNRNIEHLGETGETKWFTLESIRNVDHPLKRLSLLLVPAFKIAKKYIKGNLTTKYGKYTSIVKSIPITALTNLTNLTALTDLSPVVISNQVSKEEEWQTIKIKKKPTNKATHS
jgi:ADP-ribose pyrophosphatase YjhB (NUDIX family)